MSNLSKEIWKGYRFNDESQDDTWWRIASAIACGDCKAPSAEHIRKITDLFLNTLFTGTPQSFMPGGRIIANAGTDYKNTTLINCTTINPADLGIEDVDSINEIFSQLGKAANILKSEAGYGTNFSYLRPRGTIIEGVRVPTPGPIAFMEIWNIMSDVITRGGGGVRLEKDKNRKDLKVKIRKGAMMTILGVWHPDIIEFIKAKTKKNYLSKFNMSVGISDEFMNAVEDGADWDLVFPDTTDSAYKTHWDGNIDKWVNAGHPIIVYDTIPARELYDEMMKASFTRNEPGTVFLGMVNRNNPVAYTEYVAQTNPCITGDTVVYVADGRGDISIKTLADEGKDVPVFCFDDKEKIAIRYMRNPRWTGYEDIYKMVLDDGSEFRVTGNHKFRLTSGEYQEVSKLGVGDSLKIISKKQHPISQDGKNKKDYNWVYNNASPKAEHRYIHEFYNDGKIKKGYVIHHKNYNTQDNTVSNLELMTKQAHDKLHAKDMMGEKNPMIRWYKNTSAEEKQRYHDNMSESVSADGNGRYSGYTNEDLRKHVLVLTKQLGRRFGRREWRTYAAKHGLPQKFSNWRVNHLGDINGFAKWAALEAGFDSLEGITQKSVLIYKRATEAGYDAYFDENKHVRINKKCELCGNDFNVTYARREQGVCSATCGQRINKAVYKEDARNTQLKLYTDLKFKLSKIPMKVEFEAICKENEVPIRFGRTSPFPTYKALQEASVDFNHRVVSVALVGKENVYNGTVDDFHNFFVGCKDELSEKKFRCYINNKNCGEVPMATGVCDLGSINLVAYWHKTEGFNFKKLREDIPVMIRFLDNVLDVTTYPLPELEKESKRFRRIGLGIMGLGSLGFMMGLKYGSKEFLEFVDKLYKEITYSAYKASIALSKEKGAFDMFDADQYLATAYWRDLPLPLVQKMQLSALIRKHGLRNSHLTTIAPTGNTSILAALGLPTTSSAASLGMSGGLEPVFNNEYTRWIIVNDDERQKLEELGREFPDPKKGEWFETKDFKFSTRGDEQILISEFSTGSYEIDKNRGMTKSEIVRDYGWQWVLDNVSDADRLFNDMNNIYAGARELTVEEHMAPMSVIYKYLHLGISKTINIPSDYSYEQFKELYKIAYKNNIKGLTTYRAGTMTAVLETTEEEHDELEIKYNVKFPDKFSARGHLIKSENKKWYVILAFESDKKVKPIAVFTHTNSVEKTVITNETLELLKGFSKKYDFLQKYIDELEGKSYHQTNIEKIGRMLGLLLRHNIPLTEISETVDGAKLPVGSFIFLLNKLLKSYIPNGTKIKQTCENCGEQLTMQEGCSVCPHCGLSLC